ncbi:hypothetical protein KW796_00975 [Candidatus Parcubacteria bacterium]|nr:hypothetical protein [Candidatus Parcubacteria bacterium]
MNTKITAKDFFLQIGALAALYAGAIALINLLFRIIDTAFPRMPEYASYYYVSSPISLPVATLIIVFPLFIVLSWLVQRSYQSDPSLRDAALRKWLVYVTLFFAGIAVAIDLITLVYQFLDGQEITTGFLLKVLAVLVVAGTVFVYYLQDLWNKLTARNRMAWRILATVLVAGSIIAGFVVLGSPATQRAYRRDSDRVMHLENIQWQVISYWQQKEALPVSMDDLAKNELSGWNIPSDPASGLPYEYQKTGNLSFKLCAYFDRETPENINYGGGVYPMMPFRATMSSEPAMMKGQNNWAHPAGHYCYDRTIDPDFYPPIKR